MKARHAAKTALPARCELMACKVSLSPVAGVRSSPMTDLITSANILSATSTRASQTQRWVTYIRVDTVWLYLCVVLELHSKIIVGWSMSHRKDRQLVVQAVLMALWQRQKRTPVILHSDRGCQFTCDEYQRFLIGRDLISSMSAVGSCANNAAVEGFFGQLKRERANRRRYQTRSRARADIFYYIECIHKSRQRRKLERIKQGQSALTQQSVVSG